MVEDYINIFEEEDDLVQTLPMPGVKPTKTGALDITLPPSKDVIPMENVLGGETIYENIVRPVGQYAAERLKNYPKTFDVADPLGMAPFRTEEQKEKTSVSMSPFYAGAANVFKKLGHDIPDYLDEKKFLQFSSLSLAPPAMRLLWEDVHKIFGKMEFGKDITAMEGLTAAVSLADVSIATSPLKKAPQLFKTISDMFKEMGVKSNVSSKSLKFMTDNPRLLDEIDEGMSIEDLSDEAYDKLNLSAAVPPRSKKGVGSGKPGEGTGRGETYQEKANIAQRKAIAKHLKPIYNKAPKQDGKAVLPGQWKNKEIGAIVEKNPKLFPDGLNSYRMNQLLHGNVRTGKGRVDWAFNTVPKGSTVEGKPLQKGIQELTQEKPGGFVSGVIARSLPDDLSTVERFDEFFTSQGINPKDIPTSFPKESFDFDVMSLSRENLQDFINTDVSIQTKLRSDPYNYTLDKEGNAKFLPIVLHRAHADRSLKPMDPSFNFGGVDTRDMKILGATVNTVVQPDLERALAMYIKNKDVQNTKRIIDEMKYYFIGTKLNDPKAGFPKLNDSDYEWLIANNIVTRPGYKNYDEIVFGTLDKPNNVQIIEGELKARKEHFLPKRVYRQEYGKDDSEFYKTLAQGGMVEDDIFEEQVSVDPGTPTIDMSQESIFDEEGSYEVANLMLPFMKLFGKAPDNVLAPIPTPKPSLKNQTKKQKAALEKQQEKTAQEDIFDPTPEDPITQTSLEDPALGVTTTPLTKTPMSSVFYSDIERILGRADSPKQFNSKKEVIDFLNKNNIRRSEATDYRIPQILKMFPEGEPINSAALLTQVRSAPIKGMKVHATGYGSGIINPGGGMDLRYAGYKEPGAIADTTRERVLVIPKKLLGRETTYPKRLSGEGTDVAEHDFGQGKDNFVIGWSRLSDRYGKLPQKVEGPQTKVNVSRLKKERTKNNQILRGLAGEAESKLLQAARRARSPLADTLRISAADPVTDILKYQDQLEEISPGLIDQMDDLIVKNRELSEQIGRFETPSAEGVVRVTFADEIQSDLMQAAATRKKFLAGTLRRLQDQGKTADSLDEYDDLNKSLMKFYQDHETVFRPVTKTGAEVDVLRTQLVKMDEEVDDIVNKYIATREISDKDLQRIKTILQDNMDNMLDKVMTIDADTMGKLFPDLPLKNRNEWSDAVIKKDLYEAAYRKFILKDPNAAEYYAVSPGKFVAKRYNFTGDTATPTVERVRDKERMLDVFKRTGELSPSSLRGIGVNEFYGGPNAKAPKKYAVIDKDKPIKDVVVDAKGDAVLGKDGIPKMEITGYEKVRDYTPTESKDDALNYVGVSRDTTGANYEIITEQKKYTGVLEEILAKQARDNNSELITLPVQLREGSLKVYRITDQNGNMVATLSDERQALDLVETNPNYKLEPIALPDDKAMEPVFAIKITEEMLEPYVTHKAEGGLVEDIDIFKVV